MNKYWFYWNDESELSFECGKGWWPIIIKAFDKLLELELPQNEEYPFRIMQVKEKWAGLRIYTSYVNEEIDEIIDSAQDEAEETCEYCGSKDNPEPRNVHGWWSNLCYNCYRTEIERSN